MTHPSIPATPEQLQAQIEFLEAKLGQLTRLVEELQADRDRALARAAHPSNRRPITRVIGEPDDRWMERS